MGIPSYFSNIIRENKNILKKISDCRNVTSTSTHFYLDSNSIIYDSMRKILLENDAALPNKNKKMLNNTIFEKKLIQEVAKKILEYAKKIRPRDLLYIAFDGVAPMAKLNQQRERRNRSAITSVFLNMNKVANSKDTSSENSFTWDKAAITPGTNFMIKMGKYLQKYFNDYKDSKDGKHLKTKKIVVDDSRNIGEGEHKIFNYIRECNKIKAIDDYTHVIYGLDADLIMLCLNNLYVRRSNGSIAHNHLYLYRETPEFIRSIDRTLIPCEDYFLDISELSDNILSTMSIDDYSNINPSKKQKLLHDYVLICFFLGNDFMPHFPSINIRRGGIQRLTRAYIEIMSSQISFHSTLCEYDKNNIIGIRWAMLRKLTKKLLEDDYNYLMKEYNYRERREKQILDGSYEPFSSHSNENNKNNKGEETSSVITEKTLDILPYVFRETEKKIEPQKKGWQRRYYKYLLDSDVKNSYDRETRKIKSNVFISNLCQNFLEGLEWTLKYYTSGCPDWQWKYNYHYPPLLEDLHREIPLFDECKINYKPPLPVSPTLQLAYVLPKKSLNLLPSKIHFNLLRHLSHYYLDDDNEKNISNTQISWSFCSKFWEAHIELPHINLDILKKVIEKKSI